MSRCAAKLPWGYDGRNTEQVPSPDPYQQMQYTNLPAALLGTLKREKKPFTYTPGGVNLSEVLEARLQKRMERKKKYMEEMEQEQQNPRLLVVSPTYNSPLNMYSMENALEALELQAKMATTSRSPSLTLPRNYKFKFEEKEDFEPSQSKAFRVLQVMTDTDPHSGDKRLKNSQTVSAMRFTGLREGKPTNPSKFFHALQKITGTEEEEEEEENEESIMFEKQRHVHPTQALPPPQQHRPAPPKEQQPPPPKQQPNFGSAPKLKRPAAFLPKQQLWSYQRMPVGTDF